MNHQGTKTQRTPKYKKICSSWCLGVFVVKKALFVLVSLCLIFIGISAFADDYALYEKSGHKSPQWNGLIKAGFSAFESGDMDTSLAFMEKAYTKGCHDGLLLFKLGLYSESKKDYPAAAKFFEESLPKLKQQYPNHKESKRIYEHLGRVYYQSDQFDKALPYLGKALKDDPDNFMLLFMSGQILRAKHDYAKAIAYFQKALIIKIPADLKPNPRKTVLTELMMLTYEIKDFSNCIKYADQVLKIDPRDPIALSYKRQVEKAEFQKRQKEAIKKFTE